MIDLRQADCLEFLNTVPDCHVDLVVADPPYDIGCDGGKGWDDQWETGEEYLEWCERWTRECVRVLKPGGMLVVWGTLKTDAFLKYKLEILNLLFPRIYPQNEIIWSYNWGGRSKKNFVRKHEYAWCYSKGSAFLFNADEVRVERKMKTNPRTGEAFTNGTIPTCVWEQNNHTTSKDFINWHPTTKNVGVIERIVRAYSPPGGLVLDCFSGSGTTAVACIRSGRDFIGCERDEEYFTKSQDRITKEMR